MKHRIILLIFIVLSLFSCKDNSVSNSTVPNDVSFTPKVGTKVSFDYYTIYDSLATIKEVNALGCYYAVDESKEIDSKQALVCNFYSPFGQKFNTEMFSFDSLNSKIYMHSSFIETVAHSAAESIGTDSLPIVIADKWFTLADYNRDEWLVSENSFVDFPIFSGLITGKCEISARKITQDSIILNKQVYKTSTFMLEAKINGTLLDTGSYFHNEPISLSMSNEIVFADGIGKIRNTMSPIIVSLKYYQGKIPGSLMIPTEVKK